MRRIMRIRACIFLFLACALLTGQAAGEGGGEAAPGREYQIKAAFIYNFIKFVDWPEEKMAGLTVKIPARLEKGAAADVTVLA